MEGYGHEAGVKGGEACRRKGEDGRRGDEGEQVGSVVMGETGDSTVPSIMLSYYGKGYGTTTCTVQ